LCVWRVRHGINRDQNFYCFFPLPREVVETATCACAAVSLVRRRHLTFLFEFHSIFRPEVFCLYMSMANCTPIHTRTLGGFKSSPFDVIGSYTHLVHTHTHTHTLACARLHIIIWSGNSGRIELEKCAIRPTHGVS